MLNDSGIQATMPMTPANALPQQNGNGLFGGGDDMAGILLLLLLLGGGGGFGVGNQRAALSEAVSNDFLYTQSKVDALGQAVISQTNQLNQSMNSGFNSVNVGLCNLGHQIDSGFCNINRNVDSVKFQLAQDTCTVTNAIGASTQAILSYLTNQEINNWRERAQAAELRENNANQTATIINQLRPYPQPSYLTMPPSAPLHAFA